MREGEDMHGTQTMYQRVGGIASVKVLVDKFYTRAEGDPALNHYFAATVGDRRAELHRHFAVVVAAILGGPRSAERLPDLQAAHRHLRITRDDYWRTILHLVATMDELGLCELAPDVVTHVFATAVSVESQIVEPRVTLA